MQSVLPSPIIFGMQLFQFITPKGVWFPIISNGIYCIEEGREVTLLFWYYGSVRRGGLNTLAAKWHPKAHRLLKPSPEARHCLPPCSVLRDMRQTRHNRVPAALQLREAQLRACGRAGAAAVHGRAPASWADLGRLSKPTAAACPLDRGNWQSCWQETLLAEQCDEEFHVWVLEILVQVQKTDCKVFRPGTICLFCI